MLKLENLTDVPGEYLQSRYDGTNFSGIRSGEWFDKETKLVHQIYGVMSGVLSIVLYTDTTAVGCFGNHSLKPIYMAIGNSHSLKKSIRTCVETFTQ